MSTSAIERKAVSTAAAPGAGSSGTMTADGRRWAFGVATGRQSTR